MTHSAAGEAADGGRLSSDYRAGFAEDFAPPFEGAFGDPFAGAFTGAFADAFADALAAGFLVVALFLTEDDEAGRAVPRTMIVCPG